MNITIIDSTITEYNSILKINYKLTKENSIKHLKLKNMDISYCTGCWSCWTRTPGKCIHSDDTVELLTSIINSDIVVYITENTLGTMNSLMKKSLDKQVALLHPYIKSINGKSEHYKRYEKYPDVCTIFIDEQKNINDYNIFKEHIEEAAISSISKYISSDLITGNEESIDEFNIIKWFA